MAAISTIIQSAPVFSAPATSVATVIKGSMASTPVQGTVQGTVQGSVQGSVQGAQAQPSLKEVQSAVKQANMSLPQSNESITFGYEEKLGQLIVQVSDKATGRVIQQLPSKDFIQFQLHMREMIGLFLDKKV